MKSFSISEVLKSSWGAFKKNWQSFYVVFLVLILVSIVPSFLSSLFSKNLPALSILVSLVSWVLSVVTGLGIIKVALDVADGKKAEVSELFFAMKNLALVGKYLLTSLLFGLIFVGATLPIALAAFIGAILKLDSQIGTTLLVLVGAVVLVGAIFVSIRMQFWMYVLVEKRIWGMEVLKVSWAMTRGMVLNLILFSLVLALVNIVGAVLLLVGLLVTVPVSMLAMATVYRRMSSSSTG